MASNLIPSLKKFAVPVLWGFIALTSSLGAINYGGGFYVTVGILNLLINGYLIYKYAKNHEEI